MGVDSGDSEKSSSGSWKGPLAINLASGLFYGYAIGFVAIYLTFNTYNTNCFNMMSEGACSTLEHATCVWVPDMANSRTAVGNSAAVATSVVASLPSFYDSGSSSSSSSSTPSSSSLTESNDNMAGSCAFNDYSTVHCQAHDGMESICAVTTGCTYDYGSKHCNHNPDWSDLQTGIFAGALIFGCMIGSLVFGKVSDAIGRKKGLLIIGVLSLLACALMTGARLSGSYVLLILARILLGFSAGSACIVTPTYVEEMTPVLMRSVVGSFFQISVCSGIAIAAILGYILEPRDWAAENLHMETRFQVLLGTQWILCGSQVFISFLLPESAAWLKKVDDEVSNLLNADQLAKQGPRASLLSVKSNQREGSGGGGGAFPVKKLMVPLIGGFFLGTSLQLTGINAVMSYAPSITKAANLSPLLGNMIVAIWNFVTTLASIPLSKRFAQRSIYLTGTIAASLACLLTGIPIFPGVIVDETTRSALVGIGIVLFVGFFEMAMGPPFYILGQRLFPVEHRAIGMSFVMVIQFIANIIINVGFPLAVVGFSGGPSENQDKGMGIVFILFGCIGICCWLVMSKTLYDWEEEDEDMLLGGGGGAEEDY